MQHLIRRQPVITDKGWAITVLLEAGAIRECEVHGWMNGTTDTHAWQRALDIAAEEPRLNLSRAEGVLAIKNVLDSVGDTCPDCPPDEN